jgi:AraC-like DNA-binding protein
MGIRNNKESKYLAFFLGTLLFGIAFLLGICFEPENFGLSYIGSIPTGIIWVWAVFNDIRDMKGKVSLLKEELQMIVRSGIGTKTEDFNNLLRNLEEISYENSDVYKMRIREILNMLTDTTIEAGGDTQTLIKRNTDRAKAIETSSDNNEMRAILYHEAIELSEIIKQIPSQNENVVRKVIEYLKTHFAEDLSADDISNIAGLSKAHLMRVFKQVTGQTLKQYQTFLRIEESKKLLFNNTVTETAYCIASLPSRQPSTSIGISLFFGFSQSYL